QTVDLTYAKYQGQTLQNGVNQWLSIRFAAPPTGTRRFSAPQPPLRENATQDATKEGALCVSANNQEGLQFDSARQRMAEDCLFLAIYSPLNATTESNLPIMFFIQGGGFSSNSNGNFNGTGLVQASGMNMMVVRINYRVGMLGFIGGTLVSSDVKGAVPNNGLNDIVAAATWVKEHATKFGGNPDHIVMSGDSAGGNAIDILLTANNGAGFPDLFVGAAVESTGWGSDPYAVDRDASLAKNINSTGCLNATDPIDCMRMMPIAEFQNKTTKDGWGPTIDGKMLVAPHYQMMEQGNFQKIPVIYGTASNEATPDFISNQSATTDTDLSKHILEAVGPSITPTQIQAMLTAYPPSLNNISFFSRTGPQWQRDAAIMTELKLTCVAAFFSDMYASANVAGNYHYRYNVLDSVLAAQGIFTPHTSELYAIWGRNNTDGGDPKCFDSPAASGGCMEAIDIVQSYWISFVRTLDPNVFRAAGAPIWETWTVETPNRIVLDNGGASMEVMGRGEGEVALGGMDQRTRCNGLVLPLSKAANAGLREGETLQPFANGTRLDPTAGVSGGNGTVVTVSGNGTATNETGIGNSTGTAPKMTFTGPAGRFEAEKGAISVLVLASTMLIFAL
ncbi:alpha/beta-hydrolase, partial [Cadophora sp. DSE1049]